MPLFDNREPSSMTKVLATFALAEQDLTCNLLLPETSRNWFYGSVTACSDARHAEQTWSFAMFTSEDMVKPSKRWNGVEELQVSCDDWE